MNLNPSNDQLREFLEKLGDKRGKIRTRDAIPWLIRKDFSMFRIGPGEAQWMVQEAIYRKCQQQSRRIRDEQGRSQGSLNIKEFDPQTGEYDQFDIRYSEATVDHFATGIRDCLRTSAQYRSKGMRLVRIWRSYHGSDGEQQLLDIFREDVGPGPDDSDLDDGDDEDFGPESVV